MNTGVFALCGNKRQLRYSVAPKTWAALPRRCARPASA